MRVKFIICMFLCVLISVGCNKKNKDSEQVLQTKNVSVTASNINKGIIQNIKKLTGKTKPKFEIGVFSKLPLKVTNIYGEVGLRVKKGDLLFTLDENDVKLQVNQAKVALDIANASLQKTKGGIVKTQLAQLDSAYATAQINLNDAKSVLESTKILYENDGASKQMLDAAYVRYNIALEQFNNAKKAKELTVSESNPESVSIAEKQVKQAQTAYELAKSQLNNTRVFSPIDGVISVKNVDIGGIAQVAVPAYVIVDISEVYVDLNGSEDIISKVKKGDKCNLEISSANLKNIVGEITNISPNADARTGMYLIKIKINNTDEKIKGGMIAEAKIIIESKDNVYSVPLDTVINENGKSFIYLTDGNKAIKREIKTGISDGKFVEINLQDAGLLKLITSGQNFVEDSSQIQIVDDVSGVK